MIDVDTVQAWRQRAAEAVLPSAHDPATDYDRLMLIRALEDLKATAAWLQGELAVDVEVSQSAQQAERGVPESRCRRGVAAQVAIARRESPRRAARLIGQARALREELSQTREAVRRGWLSETRAGVVVEETTGLDRADRTRIDQDLWAQADTNRDLGTRQLAEQVRRLRHRRDPHDQTVRAEAARAERHVTLAAAPDSMARLTAYLPAEQATLAHRALAALAETTIAAGGAEGRSRGQVLADTLVARVTGRERVEVVPVTVDLVISDAALLDPGSDDAGGEDGHDPAELAGYGPIPVALAKRLIAAGLAEESLAGVRRLYADPTGQLVAATSVQRCFTDALAALVGLRDRSRCRTPWCDAPVRHIDHVTPVAEGGRTTLDDGQGLCEACNYAKQAAGWRQRIARVEGWFDQPRHTVRTITPAGHTYDSTAPPLPEPYRDPDWHSRRQRWLDDALDQIARQNRENPPA